MAKGFKSGGGGGSNPLNFQVVGNPQPENPKENTIWLDTDVKITGYSFGTSEPAAPVDGKDGPVHVFTGKDSTVEFNALKKNGIQVNPISAKQFVSGAWVDVTAKSYQNGAWVDWWNGALYDSGNEFELVTGGWEITQGSALTISAATKKQENCLTLSVTANTTAAFITKNTVDVSRFSTLNFECFDGNQANQIIAGLIPKNKPSMLWGGLAVSKNLVNAGTVSIDISSFSDEFYICFMGHSTSLTYTSNISKIWLE